MILKRLLTTAAITALVGCAGTTPTTSAPSVAANATAIEAHMQFLASDALAGRDTGSNEHEIASLYIATQLQALGLKPAGDNGSYLQRVPLRKARLAQDSAKFTLHVDGNSTALAYPKAFFTGPSLQFSHTEVTAPLVFAGYGLVSKEFGLDDYAGLDVNGKIVVLLTGRPDSLPSEEALASSSPIVPPDAGPAHEPRVIMEERPAYNAQPARRQSAQMTRPNGSTNETQKARQSALFLPSRQAGLSPSRFPDRG